MKTIQTTLSSEDFNRLLEKFRDESLQDVSLNKLLEEFTPLESIK